jgi:hypothetical protein
MQNTADPKLPSERSFGFLFMGVFAILAGYGLYKGWNVPSISSFVAASIALLLMTLVRPSSLTLLNKAWFKLGMLFGMIVSPIVVGLLFSLLITPVALVTRLCGRDALRRKAKPDGSYWIDRSPPGPATDSFNNQF